MNGNNLKIGSRQHKLSLRTNKGEIINLGVNLVKIWTN